MKKKKTIKNIGNKLLIYQIDDKNKFFKCMNVKQNINAINKMIKDKYLSIYSILLKLKNNKKKKIMKINLNLIFIIIKKMKD